MFVLYRRNEKKGLHIPGLHGDSPASPLPGTSFAQTGQTELPGTSFSQTGDLSDLPPRAANEDWQDFFDSGCSAPPAAQPAALY